MTRTVGDLSHKVSLGRTGVQVSRLGVGSAYGVSRQACLDAFDAGVNYFFWGSVRTQGMALALKDLAQIHRDELVIVLQCYVRFASMVERSIEKGLETLGLDYVDILLLGWHEEVPKPKLIEAVEKQRQKSRFGLLGLSSHQRPLLGELVQTKQYDLYHIRYNAAHTGAERDIFPHLPEEGGPGIVSFTCTRWGDLLNPKKMPPGESPMTAFDCYRFALSNPHIHVAICGPKNDEEMSHALKVLKSSPLSEEEMTRFRDIGTYVHAQKSIADWFR